MSTRPRDTHTMGWWYAGFMAPQASWGVKSSWCQPGVKEPMVPERKTALVEEKTTLACSTIHNWSKCLSPSQKRINVPGWTPHKTFVRIQAEFSHFCLFHTDFKMEKEIQDFHQIQQFPSEFQSLFFLRVMFETMMFHLSKRLCLLHGSADKRQDQTPMHLLKMSLGYILSFPQPT